MDVLKGIFSEQKPIIGMVHLRALPGSPMYNPAEMNMQKILEIAVDEAKKLEAAGVDGVQVENIWDYPFVKGDAVGYETASALAVAANVVGNAVSIPVGVDCHLNGGKAALAAAATSGAKWIRIFEFVNAYVSRAGITEAIGGELARLRLQLQAPEVKFFCDVNVKHGSHYIIHDRSVMEQAKDNEEQGAEALIVTGFETGKAPTAEKVLECKQHVSLPVLLGSGTNTANAKELLTAADGAIVGSWFKEENNWKNPVSYDRTKDFMEAVFELRRSL